MEEWKSKYEILKKKVGPDVAKKILYIVFCEEQNHPLERKIINLKISRWDHIQHVPDYNIKITKSITSYLQTYPLGI
jgi:hypothetical protein